MDEQPFEFDNQAGGYLAHLDYYQATRSKLQRRLVPSRIHT